MTVFIPIQSLSGADCEAAGDLLYNHYVEHPNSNVIVARSIKVKSFDELEKAVECINSSIESGNNIVVIVDAHSCERFFTFKDAKSLNKKDFVESVEWVEIDELIEKLYLKFQKKVLAIFISCRSASYFASSKTSHVSVLASEGEVNALRANELLTVFCDVYCESNNFDQAYNEMIKKYPLEEEKNKESTYKAVLKLFI